MGTVFGPINPTVRRRRYDGIETISNTALHHHQHFAIADTRRACWRGKEFDPVSLPVFRESHSPVSTAYPPTYPVGVEWHVYKSG